MNGIFGKLIAAFGIGLAFSYFGWAGEKPESEIDRATARALSLRMGAARVEIESWLSPKPAFATAANVRVVSQSSNGTAEVAITDANENVRSAQISYRAWVGVPVALHRVRPGDKLAASDFQVREIDVSRGLNYEYRGLIVPTETDLGKYQARNTILEGQYPLSSGIEKVPDVRRGDSVTVKLLSGEIQLSTPAVAQEPGYRDQPIRVLTSKTKRELTGLVRENGTVEVQL